MIVKTSHNRPNMTCRRTIKWRRGNKDIASVKHLITNETSFCIPTTAWIVHAPYFNKGCRTAGSRPRSNLVDLFKGIMFAVKLKSQIALKMWRLKDPTVAIVLSQSNGEKESSFQRKLRQVISCEQRTTLVDLSLDSPQPTAHEFACNNYIPFYSRTPENSKF